MGRVSVQVAAGEEHLREIGRVLLGFRADSGGTVDRVGREGNAPMTRRWFCIVIATLCFLALRLGLG